MRLSELSHAETCRRLEGNGLILGIGPFSTRLRIGARELVEPLRLLYADFPVASSEPILDFDVEVRATPWWRHPGGRQVQPWVDGERAFAPFDRALALPMMEWLLNWCVFTRPNHLLMLHSAVVERDGTAVLLSGKPGAGKSTLCAGLALRGWRLLSDEVAAFRPGATDVLPVPRPVGLKNESIDIIRNLWPDAVIGPSVPGTRKGTVAHLRPPGDAVLRATEPARPAHIVFPRFEVDTPARLEPMGKGRALLRVARQAFNYSLLGATGFDTLTSILDRCDCHVLTFGDLESAADLLESAIGVTGKGS